MELRTLGIGGPAVSAIGLGAMGMSGMYGQADEAESIATLHAAIDAGINLVDTGDFYGSGSNEMLIGEAIQGRRDKVFLQVKFGGLRGPDGSFNGYDLRPVAIKNFISYSLKRLRTDYIDLYQPSRIAGDVPLEDVIGTLGDLVKAGYVRHIGLSEVSAGTIRRAHAIHPITGLQIEYSILTRTIEAEILPTVRELGIGVTAYGVLSRGLLSGSKPTGATDFRAHLPRFNGENAVKNAKLAEALGAVAADKSATPTQLAIAWVAAQGQDVIPLVGARKRTQLSEALKALELKLTAEDLKRIDAVVAEHGVAGDRYMAEQMGSLDSEKVKK